MERSEESGKEDSAETAPESEAAEDSESGAHQHPPGTHHTHSHPTAPTGGGGRERGASRLRRAVRSVMRGVVFRGVRETQELMQQAALDARQDEESCELSLDHTRSDEHHEELLPPDGMGLSHAFLPQHYEDEFNGERQDQNVEIELDVDDAISLNNTRATPLRSAGGARYEEEQQQQQQQQEEQQGGEAAHSAISRSHNVVVKPGDFFSTDGREENSNEGDGVGGPPMAVSTTFKLEDKVYDKWARSLNSFDVPGGSISDSGRFKPDSMHDAKPAKSCKVARTALILPFSFDEQDQMRTPAELASLLTDRHILIGDELVPMWERFKLPKETRELSSHFRQLVGFTTDWTNPRVLKRAPMHRLRLNARVRRFLFSDPLLWAFVNTGSYAGKVCEWVMVKLLIFPHGALLVINVNWVPDHVKDNFTLDDLRTWLYLAKHRRIKPGLTRGWTFGDRRDIEHPTEDLDRAREMLGHKLYNAIYLDSSISLANVANWLIMLPSESPYDIPHRISIFDYCKHHTAVLLHEEPESDELREYLFHLSRQFGSSKRPPVPTQHYMDKYTQDQLLVPRSNRYLCLSRQGTVCIEWGDTHFFRHFMGIYSVLTMHVLSERVILEKLGYLAALRAQILPSPGDRFAHTFAEKDHIRRDLMQLATMLVKYRISMASDDCGGRSEFSVYFKVLRQVHGIADLKTELREELQDTLSIVESDWIEERRIEKNKERLWKIKKQEISKKKSKLKNKQKDAMDLIFSVAGAIILPFAVISGVWGMNNSDLPDVSWGWLMGGTLIFAVVAFVAISMLFRFTKPDVRSLRAQQRALDQIRLGSVHAAAQGRLNDKETATLVMTGDLQVGNAATLSEHRKKTLASILFPEESSSDVEQVEKQRFATALETNDPHYLAPVDEEDPPYIEALAMDEPASFEALDDYLEDLEGIPAEKRYKTMRETQFLWSKSKKWRSSKK